MLEQRLASLSQTQPGMLNRHLEKPKPSTKRQAKAPTLASMTPVRMAITVVLQYPILAREVAETSLIRQLKQPGIDIFCDLVETLHEHPHLTTAALLERWREKPAISHLQKLSSQSLTLSAEALKLELADIVARFEQSAKEERINALTSKPFSELTDAEKAEVQSFK
jgi:DNA primase